MMRTTCLILAYNGDGVLLKKIIDDHTSSYFCSGFYVKMLGHSLTRLRPLGALACGLKRAPAIRVSQRNLPVCTVDTNLGSKDVPGDFPQAMSKVIANTLDKPEKLVTVSVKTDMPMCRDGNADPVVAVQIWSIGVFDAQRNPGYSKAFIEFLADKLKLPIDRVAVLLHPITQDNAAHVLYKLHHQK